MKNKLNYSFNLSFHNNSLSSKDISKETFLKDRHKKTFAKNQTKSETAFYLFWKEDKKSNWNSYSTKDISLFCLSSLKKGMKKSLDIDYTLLVHFLSNIRLVLLFSFPFIQISLSNQGYYFSNSIDDYPHQQQCYHHHPHEYLYLCMCACVCFL